MAVYGCILCTYVTPLTPEPKYLLRTSDRHTTFYMWQESLYGDDSFNEVVLNLVTLYPNLWLYMAVYYAYMRP